MKLLLFDLDGTLLNNEKQITELTLQTINEYRKHNYQVGVCTSRSLPNSLTFLDILKPDLIICSGGSLIYYHQQIIYKGSFNVKETNEMIKTIRKLRGDEIEITVDTPFHNYWNYKIDPSLNDPTWGKSTWTDYSNFNEECLKFCVKTCNQQQFEQLKTTFPECDCLRFSDGPWTKLTKKGVSKEDSIVFACKHLQISLNDVTAFGDDYTDIGMLKMSGIGVAMGNAIEPVKEIADIIIGNNDEDGIAKYLLENKKWKD